jgi:hypothetical protein
LHQESGHCSGPGIAPGNSVRDAALALGRCEFTEPKHVRTH